MKLRLPHHLQTAILTAFASLSFTTISSGTLAAAFFLGSQAFADDSTEAASEESSATIDIGNTNLDAQAAMDEEEGKGEAKEPGSTPINQAGFNGRRGSSDDADRNLTVDEDGTDTGAIATGNVGAAGQADSSTAAALPSDDQGFTTTPYTTGTESSSSGEVFQVTAAPATAVPAAQPVQAATQETSTTPTAYTANSTVGTGAVNLGSFGGGGGGYSLSAPAMPRAAVVTVPEAFDATDPAAEAAKTDSGSADSTPADELGSTTPGISVGGASLVRATYSAPAPAMLGSATTQNTSTTNSTLGTDIATSGGSFGTTSGGFTTFALAAPAKVSTANPQASSGTQTFTGGTSYGKGTEILDGLSLTSTMTTGTTTGTASAANNGILKDGSVNIYGGDFYAEDYTVSIWVTKASLDSNQLLFAYGSNNPTNTPSPQANGIYWDASAKTLRIGRGNVNSGYNGMTWNGGDYFTIKDLYGTMGDGDMVNITFAVAVKEGGGDQSQTPTVWINGTQAWTATSAYNGNMNGNTNLMKLYVGSGATYGDVSITNEKLTSRDDILALMGVTATPPPTGSDFVWTGSESAAWDTATNNWKTQTSDTPVQFVSGAANTVTFDASGEHQDGVNLSAAASVKAMTVDGAAYTLNLGGNTLTTGTLNVTGAAASLTLTGTGTVTLTEQTDFAALSHVTVAGDSKLALTAGDKSVINLSTGSAGTLEVKGGSVSYHSNLGGATLQLDTGTTLIFDNSSGSTDSHTYTGNIVLGGNVDIQVYGNSQHANGVSITGNISGSDKTLAKKDLGNLTINGKVELGTLDVQNGDVTINGNSSDKGSISSIKAAQGKTIELVNTNATMANVERGYSGNLIIGDGSTVQSGRGDAWNYNSKNTLTIKTGGVLDMGSNRWTFNNTNNSLVLAGGTVTGAGDAYGALDFYNGNGIVSVTENSEISASIRLRSNTTTFDVAAEKTLTISGTINKKSDDNISGVLAKSGAGTLVLSGDTGRAHSTVVNAGTIRVEQTNALGGGEVTVNPGGTLDVVDNTLTAPTVSVNGGTITNSGQGTSTLDIETLNVGGNGAIVSGNVSLGTSADPMTTLHLENTLISKGDNAVYADEITFVGDLGESVGAGSTFKDSVSGDTANGYVVTAKVVIVENAAGTLTSNLASKTITHDGWTYTLQQDNVSGSIYISLMASTERAMQGDYYVNTGDLTYDAIDNASGQERTNTLFVNGGNLTFQDTDLKAGVALHVHKDGEVTLGEGRTLNEGAVHVKAGSTMTLKGSGTYTLDTATLHAHGILPAGTVLADGADGFTGMVMVSKDSVLNGTDLSGLVNGTYSRVGFNGATGSLKTGDIVENIYLQDYGSQVALSLNTGTSGDSRQFTGAITGTGTLARSYVTGSGDIGGIQNYEFSGNLSGWTGVFDNQVEGADNTTNLTFSGGATVVNAEIKNGVAGSTGPLNVITTGEAAKLFNKGVTATSFSANGGDVTFNGALRLTGNASAEDGAKLVINNSAAVGGSLSGDVEVTSTGNLTVGGTATLGGLTVDGMASFNNTVSASGAVTVNEGASLYLNNSGIALGNEASLSISSGSMVGLSGWTETKGTPSESGVVKTGFTGGQLFSGNGSVDVQTGSYFMKDGAKFLYTSGADSRVTVYTSTDDGAMYGTVDIIDAIYYNVHTGDTKSMDDVQAAADVEQVTLDYIHIQSGGMLNGVTDANKGTYGIGDSGLQGSGTIAVGENGQLTDDVSLMSFGGSISVGPGCTLVTDGSNTRTVSVNGGTYRATDDVTLGNNVTFSGRDGNTSTMEVDAGKAVTITKRMTADLNKTGDGTLYITDLTSTGSREAMIDGDLNVNAGTVVLASHRHDKDNAGVVSGNITMAGGTDVIMQGFDALGNSFDTSSPYTKNIIMGTGTADNLTTLSFTRNGSDPETLQHTTLSTDIYMNGNTEMSGLRLNAFGRHEENNLGLGSYVYASGMNNTITNTFAMRYNAYFEVEAGGELALTGNMELFDAGATAKKVIKTGGGVLDFAGDNSSLYAIDIQAGLVEVTGNLTFNGTEATQFLMAEGARFAVQNGATFNYRGWLFENNDGTHAAGTVTAAARSSTNILEDSNLVVSGMKLTNNSTAQTAQTINARLDGVQLMHTGGNVTINNATGEGATQHIASLTVKSGETTLHSVKLDAASVNPGATLTFTANDGKEQDPQASTVELGSTILNGGTVKLAGTVNVQDLSDFAAQSGAGYQDVTIDPGKQDINNGFYQGSTYYLVKEEGASDITVDKDFAITYKNTRVADMGKEENTDSYYFQVDETNALYYINNTTADAVYSNLDKEHATNSMYLGYTKQVEQQETQVDTTGIVMNVNGAVLTLASGLRDEVRTTTVENPGSGIVAKQNGTVGINGGVTLHQSDLSGDSGVLVSLVGAGTFDLVGTALKSVSSGLTDGSANGWRGTVRASGTADNMNATMMGNVNSTLLLDGVKGTLTNNDTQYVMKVVLQNGNGALTTKALDNTFSTGANRTFSNTVSGDGDIQMTGESADSTQSIAFTGDVSQWNGDFTTTEQGTTNLAFRRGATVINTDVVEGAGSTINLSVGPAVDAGGQSVEQVFNGNITASSLTVEAGANTTLNNNTAISGVIDTTADALLYVQGTTTANEVKLGGGQVGINNSEGGSVVAIVSPTHNGDITGRVKMQSAEGKAILAGTAGEQPVTRVEGANMLLLQQASSLQIENLVLAADTMVTGMYSSDGKGNLVISKKVVQEMSGKNTGGGQAGTLSAQTLTLTGTTGTEAQAKGDKLYSLDFTGMDTMASLSGHSATLLMAKAAPSSDSATLLMDFTGMYTAEEWADMIRDIDYLGVNFDSSIDNVDFASLTVQATGYDANGNEATYTGYYVVNNNAKSGANVGMVVYFEVPEPTTGTLSLLALAALAARRRRK